MEFSHILQSWYLLNHRDLPWRETSDAYRIWLSEIILQQTRVAQGYDYYLRFTEAFPTVQSLAQSSQEEVLKLWQGLGYYSRARNLHKAAQQVVTLFDGNFPTHYADLIKLTGVGPYTAAAIASFSSNEAVAVVDGNVYRVLARLFDIDTPIDSHTGQKVFQAMANELLDPQHAGAHNQAIMEFGALQCTPSSPDCSSCPLAEHCLALANHTIKERPVKAGKIKIRERHLNYTLYKYNNKVWVHQRGEGDIWQGLWEYALTEGELSTNLPPMLQIRHQLTHQLLICSFYVVELTSPEVNLSDDYICLTWDEWQKKPVAKPIAEANKRFDNLFQ